MAELSGDAIEAIGWMYAKACVLLDNGEDLRKVLVPEILEEAYKDLTKEV